MIVTKIFKGLTMLKIRWIEKKWSMCGPLDALVKSRALAPCTSDIHTVWEGTIGERHNLVLGHEGVGEVVEVGSMVKNFKPRDQVIIPAITPDWNTVEAQGGLAMHSGGMLTCWRFSFFKDGVFGEIFHVTDADDNLAKFPDSIAPAEAAMLSDRVPTSFHTAELADVKLGDTVCWIGIGPVGLMAVAGSNLMGALHFLTVGSRPDSVHAAKGYGATDDIINYKNGDIVEQVMNLTDGKCVDKVCIAGGDVKTIDQAIRMLKPGEKIGNVNYLGSGDYVIVPRVEWGCGMSHKFIHSRLMPGGRLRMEKLANLVEVGKLKLSPLITHRFNGFDKLKEALFLMKEKPAALIKPVVII
ncbi:MAG: zinc-binding dehydrogenase [Methanocalculaceae archaeon]|jgi:alcohol dehydrogenase (NADP+)|nr:zinc-binding dehydrogenase [Methanocalculaceae archaeon]